MKIDMEDHGNALHLKMASKKKRVDDSGFLKRFLKWLARGAEQSPKNGVCRT
ncbi:MAG: hypothetical protein JW944_12400 [Deltaproteobacteria bacterium]|nr:hypothetical protein [Deltaproteobacteria bacterium]